MITCTKIYADIPFAHRQHNHKGHCRFIHGHNWSFQFTFGANRVDGNGFIIDFGDLKWLKQWLDAMFDHKLVLNDADPARAYLVDGLVHPEGLEKSQSSLVPLFPFADVTIVPDASCEGLARYVFELVNGMVQDKYSDSTIDRRVWVQSLTVFEDSKNSATFQP